MFDAVWKIKERPEDGARDADGNGECPPFVAELLRGRGVKAEDLADFLDPVPERMADPFLLPDMTEAVQRILDAADSGEKITVYGDYDADGITATAILFHFLVKKLGVEADYYLPSRFEGGYGLSVRAVDELKKRGTGLIVTVDTGIVAFEEIKYAALQDIDTVVTDHHTCADRLPVCVAAVNPMRSDSEFPTKQLAGAGVAYKVAEALSYTVGMEAPLEYLPFAAIGTVADSMPLLGENRILVKNGMDGMAGSEFPALRLLAESARARDGGITARGVAFGIAPRINAAGRMGDASCALSFLLAETDEEAETLLARLGALNAERQRKESEILEEALLPAYQVSKPEDAALVVMGENWHPGVSGIVAARLAARFGKPVAVLFGKEADADGTYFVRASARSVGELDLYAALSECSDLMLRFGGHEKAAGFTVPLAEVPAFAARFAGAVERLASAGHLVAEKLADGYLPPALLTLENAEFLKKLEPFGQGNPEPVFITDGFAEASATAVGEKGKHLKLRLRLGEPGGGTLEGIAFDSAVYAGMIRSLRGFACVYTLSVNEWRGMRSVSLNVTDLIDGEDFVAKQAASVYNNKVNIYLKNAENAFTFTREELVALYRALRRLGSRFTFAALFDVKTALRAEGTDLSWFKIRYALDIFAELNFLQKEKKGVYGFAGEGGSSGGKRNLTDSKLFNEMRRSNTDDRG